MARLKKSLLGSEAPSVRLDARQPALPVPVHGEPRPMTGFFAGLTEEQKRRALAYRGPDYHRGGGIEAGDR